jgi:membrane-associated protease RseP (regulator of RpoE activity)
MNRFQRSWELLKSSLEVMRRDKQLLLFPILTTLCTVSFAIVFLMPVAFQRTGYGYGSSEHWQAVGNSIYVPGNSDNGDSAVVERPHHRAGRHLGASGIRPLAVGYFAVMYFASMFLATFFNVAFYQQIMAALRGEPVSIASGLQFACTKWKAILMWTLFAGLVGYIIKTLEERFGLVGQLIMRLLGTAWSIACVFVIPIIITDEEATNPFTVLKQSALTLKKTWGESLIGYAGVSFGGLLVVLFSLLWLGGGIAISTGLHLYWLTALVIAGWLIMMVLWAYLLSVASQIFRCALFLYASQQSLPAPYTEEMMSLAWKRKKS